MTSGDSPIVTSLVVRSGRNPHAISLAIGFAIISIYGLVFSPASTSLDAGLGELQRLLFAITGLTGSLVVLTGLFWRRVDTGMLIERAGQVMLACGTTSYVYVLCTVSTFERSGLITTIVSSMTIGSLWRVVQITRDLRAWNATRTALTQEDPDVG